MISHLVEVCQLVFDIDVTSYEDGFVLGIGAIGTPEHCALPGRLALDGGLAVACKIKVKHTF